MKTLHITAGFVLAACFAILAGCVNAPVKLIPPQQLVHDFCPVVNADLKILSSSPLLTPAQQATVADIESVNEKVCAAGDQIDLTDLQTLNATAFPALLQLVASIPAIPGQPQIVLGLALVQPILAQVVQTVMSQKASSPASASAPPVPAASK